MLQSAYFPSFLLFYFAFILRDGIFFSALAGANLLGSMILPTSASQVAGTQLHLLHFVIQIWTRCHSHCRHWTESSYSFLVTHVHTLNMQAQNSLLLLSVPVTLPTGLEFLWNHSWQAVDSDRRFLDELPCRENSTLACAQEECSKPRYSVFL